LKRAKYVFFLYYTEKSGLVNFNKNKEEKKRQPTLLENVGSGYKRQKPQAPTPQAPIRNRKTRKIANAKGLNLNTNLT